jgi:quercetin dioxygenase-like cupin family protein
MHRTAADWSATLDPAKGMGESRGRKAAYQSYGLASRKILLEAGVGERTVHSVQVREIVLRPGQRIGAHVHSGPVAGYVVEGELVLQIEGQAPQSLLAGVGIPRARQHHHRALRQWIPRRTRKVRCVLSAARRVAVAEDDLVLADHASLKVIVP